MLAIKLRLTSKEAAFELEAQFVESMMWLGDSMLCTRNAPKAKIFRTIATQVYESLFKN